MSGFVKLRRSLKEWEWYEDHNATRLLVHLLISVNYEDKRWRGITIKKGSLVCSWETLSKGCGLSIQQCRTNVKKLIDCGEVTRKPTNKYQVLSLVKWDKMQIKEVKATSKPTINQQTSNKQITTTKESKEYKEDKERESARTAFDFLANNQTSEFEIWLMQNKKLVNDWKRLVDNYNDTAEGEKLDFDYVVLFARLKKYTRNWISNQKEKPNTKIVNGKMRGII